MRLTDSKTREIISKNTLKFKDNEQRRFLVELTEETYDEECIQIIIFAKRLGRYLQYMVEQKNKKLVDVLDSAIIECDFEDWINSERRRLALLLLIRIWIYGDELEDCTDSDGTTKKN